MKNEHIYKMSSTTDPYREFLEYVKDRFNTEEEQIFLHHFVVYVQHGNDDDDHVIDLDDVIDWIGFSRKDAGKRTLTRNFIVGTDYVINTKKSFHPSGEEKKNAHAKEKILLNIDTFKELCMIADTDKGKTTRRYYIKLEKYFMKFQVEKNNKIGQELQEEYERKYSIQRHNDLRTKFKDQPCIYTMKVSLSSIELNNDEYLVKIGETDDIHQRTSSLSTQYPGCLLLDVVPCNHPHKLEQYILKRPDVSIHRVPKTEIVKISRDFTYVRLVNLIEENKNAFEKMSYQQKVHLCEINTTESICKQRELLLQIAVKTECPEERKEYVKMAQKLIQNPEISQKKSNQDLTLSEENIQDPFKEKRTTRKVYQYSLQDLKNHVCVFNSLKEAARSLNDSKIHNYNIQHACNNNIEFGGYRWFMVDSGECLPEEIPPTEIFIPRVRHNKGLIAEINPTSNKITNVYATINEAAKNNKIRPCSISTVIRNGRKTGGKWFKMYRDCDEELKKTFDGILPEYVENKTCSKCVQQVDPSTDEVIRSFDCIQRVCHEFRICHKKMHELSSSGDIYKGFKWRIV